MKKGGFVLVPMSKNVSAETVVQFQCTHSTAPNIGWKVNRTDLQGITEGVVSGRNEDGVHFLNITGFLTYNSTIIQCEAFFKYSPSEETYPAMMMIQGMCTYH